ncbi:DUF5723 family protein [Rapidithrix thailandica]|uniref:DUF5723 family protein n=1 Tax=Rapidithrix thailandica TaxID=413964 RepID=A0AAW9S2H9_9BACT
MMNKITLSSQPLWVRISALVKQLIIPYQVVFTSLYIFIFSQLCLQTATAQEEKTFYFMHSVPQSTSYNPAKKMDFEFAIALPIVSSLYVAGSQGATYKDVVKLDDNNDKIISISGLVNALQKNNLVRSSFSMDIFGVHFSDDKVNFNLSVKERGESYASIPKELLGVLLKGNGHADYLNQRIPIEPNMNLIHWREFGIGGAYTFSEKLTIGLNAKAVFGMGNIRPDLRFSLLTEDSDNYPVTLTSGGRVQSAGIFNVLDKKMTQDAYVLNNYKNPGFAIDFGMAYQLSKRVKLEASVLNLGKITWKTNLREYRLSHQDGSDQSYTFEGMDLAKLVTEDPESEAFEEVLDSLEQVVTFTNIEEDGKSPEAYTTTLPIRSHLSLQYEIARNFTTGLLISGVIHDQIFQPSLGLSLQKNFGSWITLSASYSASPHSFQNLGAGLVLNLGSLQVYAVSDQLISTALNYQKTHTITARAGVNFVFGHKQTLRKEEALLEDDF